VSTSMLRIATSHYHVGHAIAPVVALEQGFFKEEGLENFALLLEGLIPAFVERQALFAAMKERGIDVVLGAKIGSVLALNAAGADLFIVAGWRFLPAADWYARAGIRSVADLKGKKIGIRDPGGISQGLLVKALREAGLDPDRDVVWVRDRIYAYHNTPEHVEAFRSGTIDCGQSHLPFSDELEKMGCKVILSPAKLYPKGRPERVIAARGSVVQERRQELQALLRAILRAFWFLRDQPANFPYLAALEERLRAASHSEDERAVRMFTAPGRLETMPLVLDGEVPLDALREIVEELKSAGEIRRDFSAEHALRAEAVQQAFRELLAKKELALLWRRIGRPAAAHAP